METQSKSQCFYPDSINSLPMLALDTSGELLVQDTVPSSGTDRLYLTYSDGRMEVYRKDTLIREYTDLPFLLQEVRSLTGKRTMLYREQNACITDRDEEPLALLKGPCRIIRETAVLSLGVDALLSFPVYDADMLYDEGLAAVSHDSNQ